DPGSEDSRQARRGSGRTGRRRQALSEPIILRRGDPPKGWAASALLCPASDRVLGTQSSASRISRAPAPQRRKGPARRAASSRVIATAAVAANASRSGAVHPEVAVLSQPANGGARVAAR